ncbi:MAG: hypothetical protein OQJ84_02410 [Xanthomonadales bacterium]|nr:hypothetical protein [Xanthomonadales bacterium]
MKQYDFKRYRETATLVPVHKVTPDDGYYLHTFYDICPWSPSQRFLACTKFPFQDREPKYGEEAQICVIDMKDQTLTEVHSTSGWGFQLGSNVQWGATDRYLYFNDLLDGECVCVRLDLETGKSDYLAGPMYHVAPDDSAVVSFPLDLINATQSGYGYAMDPARARILPPGAAEDEGIWRTDLKTGKKELIVSLAQAYDILPDADKKRFEGGTFYFFHSKYNPQSNRILQVFRCLMPNTGNNEFGIGGTGIFKPMLVTFNADGSDLKLALSNDVWGKGGHHPNWHPNGEEILMNLKLDYDRIKFCSYRYDGSDFKVLSETVEGSGHPSFHANGRHIVTDVYPDQDFASKSKEVPIRLVDIGSQSEQNLCFVFTLGMPNANVLRIDPHPAWSRDYTKVCFNAAPEGRRQIFVADVSELI